MAHNPAWLINKHPKNLKAQIKELTVRGYVVTVQDSTTAQLVRRKQFSCLVATLSFLFFGVGFFIYLFYFLAQRDDTVYLDLDTQEPDPHWQEKQTAGNKRFWIVIGSFFGFFFVVLLIGCVLAAVDTGTPSTASQTPYTVAYEKTNPQLGLAQAIVITPEQATRENLLALGEELHRKYGSEQLVWIGIFTDKDLATKFEEYTSDAGLPATTKAAYEKAWIGIYSRVEGTGLDHLVIQLDGLNGEGKETVKY